MNEGKFSITTRRLVLREFRVEDAENLWRLCTDPDVMRYTGEPWLPDVAAARQRIESYRGYRDNGFGRWAVESIRTGEFMGYCGLHRKRDTGVVDLAFRLFPEFWSHGFATEAARASLDAGFETFGLNDVVGRALRENLPSVSVLQKLGMRYRHLAEEDGEFWLIYGISRAEYQRQRGKPATPEG